MTAMVLALIFVQTPSVDPAAAYRRDVEAWRQHRLESLTADGGWLTVAGLFWLEPGANTFGAATTNRIRLPAHSAPPRAGTFTLDAGRVTVDVLPGVAITAGGQPVARKVLRSDASGEPDVLALGALTMQIIDRGGRLGVRLKDLRSELRRSFKGLTWYPVNPALRVTAHFMARSQPTRLEIPSVIGVTESMPSPGTAEFELAGKTYRLDPVLEPGESRLFFIFRDATAGRTTYGAGRFLYAEPPRDGKVVLDFNQAYSPPCAFTPYATCPLPPPQNRLPIAIEAGEKYGGALRRGGRGRGWKGAVL
jgi:uncharacterized protein (DUF1684 family)